MHHPTDRIAHTSRGRLAGMRNSSLYPPQGLDLMPNHGTTSRCSDSESKLSAATGLLFRTDRIVLFFRCFLTWFIYTTGRNKKLLNGINENSLKVRLSSFLQQNYQQKPN